MTSHLSIFTVALGLSLMLSATAVGDMTFPRALRPGDTIAFVAPARPVARDRMERAKRRLESMGFRVRMPDELFRKHGYLAGTDEQRAREVMAAFEDRAVDAVFPVTGGFGTTKILDHLDYGEIRRNPKVLIGFSDITGLHLAVHKRCRLVTFHSPNPDGGLGVEDNLAPFSAHWFYRAILADRYPSGSSAAAGYLLSNSIPVRRGGQIPADALTPATMSGGRATGRLVGGNLSLIAALMGTPYEIETDERVLFIEDIGEAPYRVDRMLSTLRLAGKLDNLAGVVLGMFTRRASEDTSGERVTIDDVLYEYFADLGVPVIHRFPVGHYVRNITIPIGVMCEVDADAGTIRLLENPVKLDP